MEQGSQEHFSSDGPALIITVVAMLVSFIWLANIAGLTSQTGPGHEIKASVLVTETVQQRVDALAASPSGVVVSAGDHALTLLDINKPGAPGTSLVENSGKVTALLYTDFGLWAATQGKDQSPVLVEVRDLGQTSQSTIRVALPQMGPDLRVTALAAGLGRLWVGTNQGLLSYDWSGWHQHRLPTRFRLPGVSRDIRALYLDSRGLLWIGTSKGLFSYNGTEVFPFTEKDGLPSNVITAITGNAQGELYCGTDSGLATLKDEIWVRQAAISGNVAAVVVSDEEVWVAADSELFRHEDGAWLRVSQAAKLPSCTITALSFGTDALYVGTEQGLYRVMLAGDAAAPAPAAETPKPLIPEPAPATASVLPPNPPAPNVGGSPSPAAAH